MHSSDMSPSKSFDLVRKERDSEGRRKPCGEIRGIESCKAEWAKFLPTRYAFIHNILPWFVSVFCICYPIFTCPSHCDYTTILYLALRTEFGPLIDYHIFYRHAVCRLGRQTEVFRKPLMISTAVSAVHPKMHVWVCDTASSWRFGSE